MMFTAALVILTTLMASASAFPVFPFMPFDMPLAFPWTLVPTAAPASKLVEEALAEVAELEARRDELESNRDALEESLALLKREAPDAPGTALVEELVGQKVRCIGLEEDAVNRLLGGRQRVLEALHRDVPSEEGAGKSEEEVVVE